MDGFRRLTAWKKCVELTVIVYRVTDHFPAEERFELARQFRRAAISACGNVAEGHGRRGGREFSRFLGIATGSLAEVAAYIELGRRLAFIGDDEYDALRTGYLEASKTTYGLMRAVQRNQRKAKADT